jgi:hypothetical protein
MRQLSNPGLEVRRLSQYSIECRCPQRPTRQARVGVRASRWAALRRARPVGLSLWAPGVYTDVRGCQLELRGRGHGQARATRLANDQLHRKHDL